MVCSLEPLSGVSSQRAPYFQDCGLTRPIDGAQHHTQSEIANNRDRRFPRLRFQVPHTRRGRTRLKTCVFVGHDILKN